MHLLPQCFEVVPYLGQPLSIGLHTPSSTQDQSLQLFFYHTNKTIIFVLMQTIWASEAKFRFSFSLQVAVYSKN